MISMSKPIKIFMLVMAGMITAIIIFKTAHDARTRECIPSYPNKSDKVDNLCEIDRTKNPLAPDELSEATVFDELDEDDILLYINSVSGHDERDTIIGNFTGNGIDTIYVHREENYSKNNEGDQRISYYAKSNNPELPVIKLWGCDEVSPKLVYEGDVDGNGKDEWGYLHTWMTSQWRVYRIYTLVDKEWRFVLDPTNELLNTDLSFRASGVDIVEKCGRKGYIKINYTDGYVNSPIRDTIVAATYTKITKDNN
jgi:hypothetical protein